jgi:transposase-like protein
MASDKKREQYWRELIDHQRTSGQTVSEFCTKSGVSTASFYTWKRKLNAEAATTGKKTNPGGQRKKEPPAQMTSLVPVQVVADPSASDAPVEVHLPGAVVLRIGSGCEEQTLRVVLAALANHAAGDATRC